MRPREWNPSIELSENEQKVAKRIRKAKLFLFLREIRHELFDSEFQLLYWQPYSKTARWD